MELDYRCAKEDGNQLGKLAPRLLDLGARIGTLSVSHVPASASVWMVTSRDCPKAVPFRKAPSRRDKLSISSHTTAHYTHIASPSLSPPHLLLHVPVLVALSRNHACLTGTPHVVPFCVWSGQPRAVVDSILFRVAKGGPFPRSPQLVPQLGTLLDPLLIPVPNMWSRI